MDFSKLFSLEGKVAIVTGGSRGIGKMIAEGFIAAGAKVYITARKASVCDQTAEELGENCISLPADISSMEGIKAFVSEFSQHESRLDILVNNAGAAWGANFEDFPEEGWEKVMDLNVKSPFFLTQAVYELLKSSASAETPTKVINITSVDGLRVNPWETYSYQASKAALIQLTKRMAYRLVRDHIYVTSIAPGAFPSNMNKVARDAAEMVGKGIPNGRVGTTEDMAGAAIFLASRAGDYVIGSTLPVDGGIVNAWADDKGFDAAGH